MNSSQARGALLDHATAFDRPPSPRSAFALLIYTYLELLPRDGRDGLRDGRRAAMIRALDGRASWIMIRHWIRGTNRVPLWATDLLKTKLARRRAEIDCVL